jgi:hypothetical protein
MSVTVTGSSFVDQIVIPFCCPFVDSVSGILVNVGDSNSIFICRSNCDNFLLSYLRIVFRAV